MLYSIRFIFLLGTFVLGFLNQASFAFTLSGTVEAITVPSVGATPVTVNFENTYTAAIPVCTYEIASRTNPPALVRIVSIGTGSMQIRLQRPRNSSTLTAGRVFCLVAETGVSTLPDGRRIEARTAGAPNTHGRNVPLGFANGSITTMNDVSASFSGFTNGIVLGQVISYNDTDFSLFHANNCNARGAPPVLGATNSICVTKHVGEDNTVRAAETLGIIAIQSGSGSYSGIAYRAALGDNTIDGVQNNGNTYAVAPGFEFAVATQSAENGGDGGWGVFMAAPPVGGASIRLAIDEDQLNDTERSHTQEQLAYFVVRRLPDLTATKQVDRLSIAQDLTLNYTIVVENTGELDQTGVTLTDILPDGSTGTLTGPVESITTDGILEADETFTYTISYAVSPAEIAAGLPLVNNVSVTSTEYGNESLADETSFATTTIVPANPSIRIEKSADPTADLVLNQDVTYTYVVTNNGNQFLTNVSVTDVHNGSGPVLTPVNEAITNDTGVLGDSADGTPNDGVWDTLAPGDQVTFTATYTVTQTDIDTLQ